MRRFTADNLLKRRFSFWEQFCSKRINRDGQFAMDDFILHNAPTQRIWCWFGATASRICNYAIYRGLVMTIQVVSYWLGRGSEFKFLAPQISGREKKGDRDKIACKDIVASRTLGCPISGIHIKLTVTEVRMWGRWGVSNHVQELHWTFKPLIHRKRDVL